MAGSSGSEPDFSLEDSVDLPDYTRSVFFHEIIENHCVDSDGHVDLSGWTICQDSESHQKRSDIFREIIKKHCLDQLRTIVESGWDVNEELTGHYQKVPLLYAIIHSINNEQGTTMVQLLLEHGANADVTYKVYVEGDRESKWVQRTALHEAVRGGRTDVVKMLLDAGATCTTSDGAQNPLKVVLDIRHGFHTDLIKMLLNHGVDPNDHDDQPGNIPLFIAIDKYHREPEYATLIVQLLLEHGANPNVAHRVNIRDYGQETLEQTTALREAAFIGSTELVKMLLAAGATSDRSDLHGPMLRGWPEVVKMLLDAGVKPNSSDLSKAVSNEWTDVVKIFLDTSAVCKTPDILGNLVHQTLKHDSLDVIKLLLEHGADVNYTMVGDSQYKPFLHRLTHYTSDDDYPTTVAQLELFFQYGGNINMEDSEHRTALEYAVRGDKQINCIRWLIRHGADTTLKFTMLKKHFMSDGETCSPKTPLLLLQAGMRVSHGAQTQLSNMEVAISTRLQDDNEDDSDDDDYGDLNLTIRDMWGQLEMAEEEELQRVQYNVKKCTFPEYWTRQMVDLQEFRDESLQIYPKYTHSSTTEDPRQLYQNMLDQIRRILQFLSQPKSLQWYCRRYVRENLVSLQPSVVKTLIISEILKRYIMCHEL